MISIIIPIYNAESYLEKCLDSVIGQTHQDLEIICVDDGSKDNSSVILKQYQEKDQRIVVHRQENQGLSGARNAGIRIARGEWCMFLDSDDWLETDCCQSVLDAAKRNEDLVFFSYTREFANKSLPKHIFEEKEIIYDESNISSLYEILLFPNEEKISPEKIDSLSTAWGKLYKTHIIKDNNILFVDTKKIGTEDLLFNIYYFTYIKSVHYIPQCLYHYRKVENSSLSSANKPQLITQWENLFSFIQEWIAPMNNSDYLKALSNRKAFSIIGIGLNLLFAHEGHIQQHRKLKSFMQKDWYRKAIRQLPLKNLPIHWKTFFLCDKLNMSTCVYIMLLMIYKIIYR